MYRYRLTGLDDDWIDNGRNNRVRFSSLPEEAGAFTRRSESRRRNLRGDGSAVRALRFSRHGGSNGGLWSCAR